MLELVEIEGKKYWIEFSIPYELWASITDYTELKKLVLKGVNVKNVYKYDEIAYDIKRTVASLLKDDYSIKQVVREVSELYEIDEAYVSEVIDEFIIRKPQRI